MNLLECIDIVLSYAGVSGAPNWKTNQNDFYVFARK
jgi:hypothetical protein